MTQNPNLAETSADSGVGTRLAHHMRDAVLGAVAPGPEFLQGSIDADDMAKHMVKAVQGFEDHNRSEVQRLIDGEIPSTPEHVELWQALRELYVCGSGYLADRCDADCVARTMTQMVHEFPPKKAS